jgi:hypothetical protein
MGIGSLVICLNQIDYNLKTDIITLTILRPINEVLKQIMEVIVDLEELAIQYRNKTLE